MNKKGSAGKNSLGRGKRSEASERGKIRYRLKAAYEKNKRIYAVLDISAESTLDDVCTMILDAFDFTYEHLYLFNFAGRGYGKGSHVYAYMPEPGENGTDVKLGDLNLTLKQKFYFLYDFGDDWRFDIQVQKIYETKEHVINGIVSVKGELEQYPEWDEDEEDWFELEDMFDDTGDGDLANLLVDVDEDDLEKIMSMLDEEDLRELSNMSEEELEDLIGDMMEQEAGIFGKGVSAFQIDPTLTVREIVGTLEEEDLRMCAAAFLGQERYLDCMAEKDIDRIRDQYASALLQNREHMLLFQRDITVKLFQFMMTAKIDPETGVLDWKKLLETMFTEDEVHAQESYISFMYLYTMGVCMPRMNDENEIQTFLIPQEMRDAYENWMNQSEVSKKQRLYEKLQEAADIHMIRYGVIEMDRLYSICKEMVRTEITKEDFAYLINSRLVYFGRYEIYTLEEEGVSISYVSAFSWEDTEAVLQERKKYPDLTYRPFSMEHCQDFVNKGPFYDVEGYDELVESMWKSVQDVQVLTVIIRKVTDMGMLGADAEDVIKGVRSDLNASGKRMTKKFQGLIRSAVKNMPLAARYGYMASEQDFSDTF